MLTCVVNKICVIQSYHNNYMDRNPEKYGTFLNAVYKLFLTYLLGLGIFFLFRSIYLVRFSPDEIRSYSGLDLILAFLRGIQFDSVVLCYFIFLPLILSFIFIFFRSPVFLRIFYGFSKYFFFTGFLIIVFILFVDQQYYTYFQSHINVIIFGFFEDDTLAVLKSIWKNYSLVWLVLIYLGCVITVFLLFKKIWVKSEINFSIPLTLKIILPVLIIGLCGLGMRGSLRLQVLSEEDAAVSGNKFINLLPVNGIFAVRTAIIEHSETLTDLSTEEMLKNFNRNSIYEIIHDYSGTTVDTTKYYADLLFKTTPENPFFENNKPDVVFVMMESFGGYFLNYNSKTLNLLGNLDEHAKTDFFFRNFISSTRGTIYSLESILTNSVGLPIISNTSRRFIKQSSSVAFPFKNSGYETIFITTGKINWRNLNELLPNLYFERLIGSSVIQKDFPEAVFYTWGLEDKFLFREIMKVLEENTLKPKMIFAMTTNNHIPFRIPEDYEGFPVNIPDSLYRIFISNNDIAQTVFKSYQYSCNCLGDFMSQLKATKHGLKTIVGATGDHNNYSLFPFETEWNQPADQHLVPFYLYIPEAYLLNAVTDITRYGSHKDIFPTIIAHSLSNQRYFSAGNDLLGTDDNIYFGDNLGLIYASPKISVEKLEMISSARRQFLQYYFSDYYKKREKILSIKTSSASLGTAPYNPGR